jgi:hypothetical protein
MSLSLAHGVDDQLKVAEALEGVAAVAVQQGRAKDAASVLGAAAVLRQRTEAPVAAHRRPAHERVIAAARAALDPATFTAEWDTGGAWPLPQTVSEAQSLVETLAQPPF